MLFFWISSVVTFIAWALEIYLSDVASHFFLLSTFFFVFYFMVPILKKPYKMIDVSLLPLFLFFVFDNILVFWLIVAALALYVSAYLTIHSTYIYLSYLTVLTVLFPLLEREWLLALTALLNFVLFFFVIIHWKQADIKKVAYKDDYETLYRLYRSSKRQVGDMERVTRQEERNQMAREIHDSVGHRLTALTMQLEAARLQAKTSESQETFAQLKTLAQDSLADTRNAVRTFKTEDTAGLQAVIQLIRKLEAESQLRVAITMKAGVLGIILTNQQSVTLYRAIQESLTNMMRHSSSRQAMVEFQVIAQRELRFQITHSVKEQITIKEGFGLTNMRERLADINGKLTINQVKDQLHLIGQFPLEVKNSD